jgi:hypothetical protein
LVTIFIVLTKDASSVSMTRSAIICFNQSLEITLLALLQRPLKENPCLSYIIRLRAKKNTFACLPEALGAYGMNHQKYRYQ